MSEAVLDSSAVLALLQAEPGSAAVEAVLPGALLSTVNLAEIVSKLADQGIPAGETRAALEGLALEIVDFDADQACLSGELRDVTRPAGLSLGDRACLALAKSRDLPALTADGAWRRVPGLDIRYIRQGLPSAS